jgi:hypothetical protein
VCWTVRGGEGAGAAGEVWGWQGLLVVGCWGGRIEGVGRWIMGEIWGPDCKDV